MNKPIFTTLAICMMVATTAARAKQYRLTASGTVSSFTSLYAGSAVLTPPTAINIGDAFTAVVSFDTSKATLTSLFDADPTINIYYLADTRVTVKVGSYASVFSPPTYVGNSSIQIWNDRPVVGLTDSQSFSFYDYPTAGPYPFDLPGPRKQQSLSVDLFDFTHTARSNDLISQIAPVSAFGSKLLSYSFNSYNAAGGDQRFNLVDMSDVSISLTSAVPESETWMLLITGFALIGSVSRFRRGLSRA